MKEIKFQEFKIPLPRNGKDFSVFYIYIPQDFSTKDLKIFECAYEMVRTYAKANNPKRTAKYMTWRDWEKRFFMHNVFLRG